MTDRAATKSPAVARSHAGRSESATPQVVKTPALIGHDVEPTDYYSQMEPSAAVAAVEVSLRRLVERVFSAKTGSDWQQTYMDEEANSKLRERQVEEAKRRYPAIVSERLLDYTHLHELRKLIEASWQDFSPALGKLAEFRVLMSKVEDYRNAPSHSRLLLPYERALLEGIAGEIRTRVVQYMSTLGPDKRYYPTIDWVRDSFGNEIEPVGTIFDSISTRLEIEVGDEVTFEARGWDAQGRELQWHCFSGEPNRPWEIVGEEVELHWRANETDVGSNCWVFIEMKSSGDFHRERTHDGRVALQYSVAPPRSGGS